MTIRTKLLVYFGLMAASGITAFVVLWLYGLPIVGVEGVYSHEYQRAISSVQSLADKQSDAYEQWFTERRHELHRISNNETLSTRIAELHHIVTPALPHQHPSPLHQRTQQIHHLYRQLERQLQALKESNPGSYNYLYIADPVSGRILVSTEPDLTAVPQLEKPLITDGAEPGLNQFVFLDNKNLGPNAVISSQILGIDEDGTPDGNLRGILIASISLNAPLQNDDISIKQRLGNSGNLFLISPDQHIIVNFSTAANRHAYEFVASQAVSGTEGVKLLSNTDGETVMTVFRHLLLGTENGLTLAVARGTNELLSVTRTSFTRMVWLVALLFIAAIIFVRTTANHIARAEYKIVELNHHLEERVEERTHELEQANHNLIVTLDNLEQTRDDLIRSEKLAALGAMVAGIAHELNTPIGNSVTVASTLQDQANQFLLDMQDKNKGMTRSRLERFVNDTIKGSDILMRSLFQAAELISSFKQVAVDQSSLNMRRFRLNDTVSEILITLGPAIRKTSHRVTTDIPTEIMMESYPGPLGQIIINLVNNALLHAFEGRQNGTILISARMQDEETVQFSVEDNGVGIPNPDIGRVFDPFFTTKLGMGGSGLGLNITYNLVRELLGGDIQVTSTEGHGACFVLNLPLKSPVSPLSES